MKRVLLIALLLIGCPAQQAPVPDPPPRATPQPMDEEEIDRLLRALSAEFAELETAHKERYRLALIEGRAKDACEINNAFVRQAKKLCRESPVPMEGCWPIMVKATSDCDGLVNN